jgi:hypothetical protein
MSTMRFLNVFGPGHEPKGKRVGVQDQARFNADLSLAHSNYLALFARLNN